MGARGMVSTGHPLASCAAVEILKAGGNAVDAALCASGVLSVVKSYHCGLGGDLFGIFYSAEQRQVFVLNGSGRSPRLTRRKAFGETIPHRGILAANVPGTVDAWAEAAATLGSQSLGDLLKPAISYAEEGFPIFPHLHSVIRSSSKALSSDPAWANVFLPKGKQPEIGDLLIQNDLSVTLRRVAEGGRDAFYQGEIADAFVKISDRRGGSFCSDDFLQHRSRWQKPLRLVYEGHEICVPPPNSYGLLLLLQLKAIANFGLADYGHNAPAYVAQQLKAKEEAWRLGNGWVADPDACRRKDLETFLESYPQNSAADDVTAANRAGDTTYIATADNLGNWASLIQSVHHSFGCGVVIDGTGIVLNNRMSGFNLIPNHRNELAAAKLPAHTLSPALVLQDSIPVLAIGTPGGAGQTQFLVQCLCNLFHFKMSLQEAIEAPRWLSEDPGHVQLESRIPGDVSDFLKREGYNVKVCGPWEFAFGGIEAISRRPRQNVFMGAADPRRDGYAIGY